MKFWQNLVDKYHAYKLQKAIAVLRDRTHFSPEVQKVALAFDATLAATKKMNGARTLAIMVTKHELEAFVKYVTRLHDTKLTNIQELKYAVTAILMKRHLTPEDVERFKTGGKRIILPNGSGNRNERRLREKDLRKR
ncbi:MAG: hypothetical protein ACRCV5_07490 [Afipia sp.]